MAFPALLGLLGLAGGAMGQEWYFGREEERGRERLKGLLGRPPDPVPDGGYANPDPGSGLMADPASIQRQLEFMGGLMSGMTARQRGEVRSLIEPILGRASQISENQVGRVFQAGENQLSRNQAQSHFEQTHARIGEHFERSHGLLQEQFAFNKEKYGDEDAWKRYTWGQEMNLRRASEARLKNQGRLGREQGGSDVKLPTGYRGVMVPTGVPTDAPLGAGVMGPVRTDPGEMRAVPIMGTPDWVKGQGDVDLTSGARLAVQKYLDHVKKWGFQKTGAESGVQKQLYTRTQDAVRVLRQSGTMNIGEMPIIKEELPDPTEVLSSPTSQKFVLGHLGSLQDSLGDRERQLRQKYRGWQLTYADLEAGRPQGASAPPVGSTMLGGGGYGGRGSGR